MRVKKRPASQRQVDGFWIVWADPSGLKLMSWIGLHMAISCCPMDRQGSPARTERAVERRSALIWV